MYTNDQYSYINLAPTRKVINGKLERLQTIAYYYKGETFTTSPRFPGIMIGNYGTVYDTRLGTRKSYCINHKGYAHVAVYDAKLNKITSIGVHRLVMIAFNPVPNYEELQVNHIDGNKLNNYYNPMDPKNNLEWCTNRDNMDHAVRNGLTHQKYDEAFIRALLDRIRMGRTVRQAVTEMGCEYTDHMRSLVDHLLHRGDYAHIMKDYVDLVEASVPKPHYDFTDEEVHKLCQLMQQELSIDYIQAAMGYSHHTREGFRKIMSRLRRNKIQKYAHITTAYFPPGDPRPRLSR